MSTKCATGSILRHLLFILFLDIVAFSSILPLFPAIIDYYGSSSVQGDLYSLLERNLNRYARLIGIPKEEHLTSVAFGGMLSSLFCTLQFISTPWFGAMSDIHGRKRMLLLSVAGSSLSYALWLQASSFSVFFASRVIGGLSKATMPLAIATVSDIYPPETRGYGMAFIGIAFSTGFLVGPSIGAYIAYRIRQSSSDIWSITAPACFSLLVTVTQFCWIRWFLPETLPKSSRAKRGRALTPQVYECLNPKALFLFRALAKREGDKQLTKIRLIGLRFGFNSAQQGKMFLFIGLLMMFVQGGYVRKLKPERQKSAASMVSTCIPHFYAAIAFYSIASGIVVPCLTTELSSQVDANEKGTALGIFRGLGALSRAVGPIWASAVFWHMGSEYCYLMGAALTTIPLILLQRV
uniref:MFS domain-containing protein n=1 Tax=Trichuris muris TaxID=70415 RepID=A0A5S6PZI3_TRIMR